MPMGGSNMQGEPNLWVRPLEPAQLAMVCAGVVAAVGIVDLLTANINLAILYALPVVIAAQSARGDMVALMAASAIALTYAGYFVGPRAEVGATFVDLLTNYRLFNRTLCATALFAITVMTLIYMSVHMRLAPLRAEMRERDADRAIHTEVLELCERITAMTVCAVLVIWVAVMDFLAPHEFNLSILYIVPLASMTWVRSRQLLWTMFAILLICTFVGYLLSFPQHPVNSLLAPFLLRNRFLAALVLFGCTTLLHFAMAPRDDFPAGDAPADPVQGAASLDA